MQASARNVFSGSVSALVAGAVNAEVEITTKGGDKIVAIVTKESVETLALAVGKEAVALVKAPWVVLLASEQDVRFSARNQLAGRVLSINKGMVNSEVALALPGGSTVYAVVTNDAVRELALQPGTAATALFKASQVIVGIPT